MNVRTEKINSGGFWILKRTYKQGDKVIGIITKNPYTNKYEVQRSDFINHKMMYSEYKTFSKAKMYLGVHTSKHQGLADVIFK